jgi:integration host factor subunit beta
MIRNNGKTKTFTKRDIVHLVAAACQDDLVSTAKRVDEMFIAIRKILTSADPAVRIEVRDFGVLEVKPTRSKPKARNPKSGEIVFVPARRKTHFKPSKLLKKFLAQPLEE